MMHKWLQDYAYRIAINWIVFLLAGIAALVAMLVAVGMFRVMPAMLPPTIIEQPTSEITRPNPFSTPAITAKRTSLSPR